MMARGRRPFLTRRQYDCLYWAARGKSAAVTGMILGISEETVRFHRRKAMQRLGQYSVVTVLVLLTALGIIVPIEEDAMTEHRQLPADALAAEAAGRAAWDAGLSREDCPHVDDCTGPGDYWTTPAGLRQCWLAGWRQGWRLCALGRLATIR